MIANVKSLLPGELSLKCPIILLKNELEKHIDFRLRICEACADGFIFQRINQAQPSKRRTAVKS